MADTTGPLEGEDLMPFRPAFKGYAQPNAYLSTLIRWATDGVRAKNGQPVRLEAVRLGSR